MLSSALTSLLLVAGAASSSEDAEVAADPPPAMSGDPTSIPAEDPRLAMFLPGLVSASEVRVTGPGWVHAALTLTNILGTPTQADM